MRIIKNVNVTLVVRAEELFFENGSVEQQILAAIKNKLSDHIHPTINIQNVDVAIDWES